MTSVRRTCKDQTRKCVTLHQAIPERLWCKWVHVIESEGLNIFLINKQKIKSILWGTGVQCTSVNWIIWAPTLVASLTLEVCGNLLSSEMPFVNKLPIATCFTKWWWSTLLFVCQKVALATGRKKLPLTTNSSLSQQTERREVHSTKQWPSVLGSNVTTAPISPLTISSTISPVKWFQRSVLVTSVSSSMSSSHFASDLALWFNSGKNQLFSSPRALLNSDYCTFWNCSWFWGKTPALQGNFKIDLHGIFLVATLSRPISEQSWVSHKSDTFKTFWQNRILMLQPWRFCLLITNQNVPLLGLRVVFLFLWLSIRFWSFFPIPIQPSFSPFKTYESDFFASSSLLALFNCLAEAQVNLVFIILPRPSNTPALQK